MMYIVDGSGVIRFLFTKEKMLAKRDDGSFGVMITLRV
jgi:hypothetical protein